MVASNSEMVLCMLLVVFPCITQGYEQRPTLAAPFSFDKDLNPVHGDRRIFGVDDQNTLVTLTKPFKFLDRKFTEFYISPNGIIKTEDPISNSVPRAIESWDLLVRGGAKYDILVFLQDVSMYNACGVTEKTCGIFWRKGSDNATGTAISKIIKGANLDHYYKKDEEGEEIPADIPEFYPDPELTLVVTWHKVPKFKDEGKRNTFQGIITSDGTRSYAIFSYLDLAYPDSTAADTGHFKAGVIFNPDDGKTYCKVPVDLDNDVPAKKEELLCKSNVYRGGTFIIGLTDKSYPTCHKNALGESVTNVVATCSKCADISKTEIICPASVHKHVCDNDGITHDSICELKKAACMASHGSKQLEYGGKCFVHPCEVMNGGCEDKCFVMGRDYKCGCHDGQMLKNDGASCDWLGYYYIGSRNMMIISSGKYTHLIYKDLVGEILAVAHDYGTNTLFFSIEYMEGDDVAHEIRSYNPTTKYRTILDSSEVHKKVIHMIFDAATSTLYYAEGGLIKSVQNVYGPKQLTTNIAYYFHDVSGLNGEACLGLMFVTDSAHGTISTLNERYPTPKEIITGLSNPSGLAIDYYAHKIYWYSDQVFEESDFDGSCRRVVGKNVTKRPFSLSYIGGYLIWTTGEDGSMMQMNIKDGIAEVVFTLDQPLYDIGMIVPHYMWVAKKMYPTYSNGSMIQRDITQPLGKLKTFGGEYKVTYKFSATSGDKMGHALSFSIADAQHGKKLLLAMYYQPFGVQITSYLDIGDGDLYYRVNIPFKATTEDQWLSFEIGQEKEGEHYRYFIRANGQLRYAAINTNVMNYDDVSLYVTDSGKVKQVALNRKEFKPFCPIKKTCGKDKCKLNNGGCEDICHFSEKNHTNWCECSDGKALKSDGKSCDWRHYLVVGGGHLLVISNGFTLLPVPLVEHVTAVDYDYSENTVFFATELPGVIDTKYTIKAYQPKHTMRTILHEHQLNRKVTVMMYDPTRKDIFFATDDGQIHLLHHVFGKKKPHITPVHNFTSVAGMGGEKCHNLMFVVDSKEGSIYAFGAKTPYPYQPIITGLVNPRGLAIDYTHQLIYWSSDDGIEESSYDGSCRRFVIKSLGDCKPIAMVFADALYWTDGNEVNGLYPVWKTDVYTGSSMEISYGREPNTAITYIYPQDGRASCPHDTKSCPGDCSINNGGCEDKCVTVAGKTKCKCSNGKRLKPDTVSCDWTDYMYVGMDKLVMFYKGDDIGYIETKGKVISMEFDFEVNTLFYSEEEPMDNGGYNYSINSYHPKKGHMTILRDIGGPAEHLMHDIFSESLFFSIGPSLKWLFNIHGGEKEPIVIDAVEFSGNITGIIGEACNRTLFVAIGGEGAIYMFRENNVSEMIITGLANPTGLVIDYVNHKILWNSDSGLEESNYDGSCRRIIAALGNGMHLEMHLDFRSLFWNNVGDASVSVTNIDTGHTTYLPTKSEVLSVDKALDKHRYPEVCPIKMKCSIGDCSINNGGCEDKCAVVAGKAQCDCIAGKLKPDQKTCDLTGWSLQAADGSVLLSDGKHTYARRAEPGMILAVEYDYERNTKFYSTGSSIYNWDNQVLYTGDEKDIIERLAFDDNTKDMYYTTQNFLHVIRNISENSESMNLTYFGRTSGLAYEPCEGKVFVTCTESDGLYAWQEGKPLQTILSGLDNPKAVTIDLFYQKLYFFEADKIIQTSYAGSCKTIVAKGIKDAEPYGVIAMTHLQYLFWSDTKPKSDRNYYMWNTTFDGNTNAVYKGPYITNDIKAVFNRSLGCPVRDAHHCIKGIACRHDIGCEGRCIVKDDKPKCVCLHGVLKPDQKGCDYTGTLITAVCKTFVMTDVKESFTIKVAGGTRGVEFDFDKNTIYYSVLSEWPRESQVYRFDSMGHTLVLSSPQEIQHLAFDSVQQVMYYTTKYNLRRFNVHDRRTLGETLAYFKGITGLAFEPCERKVFVTTNQDLHSLKVWQEGKGAESLPVHFKNDVGGLAIDIVKHKLYVMEMRVGIIEVNYDGSCKKTVAAYTEHVHTYGMVYVPHGNYLIWTDTRDSRVMKTTLDDGKTYEATKTKPEPYAVKYIFDRKFTGLCPAKMSCDIGVCAYNNSGCEQICSEEWPKKAVCSCRYGGQLRSDGKTCDYSQVIYAASGRYLLVLYGGMLEHMSIVHQDDNVINAIAHVPEKNGIFYACVIKGLYSDIHYIELGTNTDIKIISQTKYVIESLAYDQQENALYHARSDGEIHRLLKPLSGGYVDEHLLKDAHPTEIVLSYCNRDLLYIDMDHKFGKIMKLREGQSAPEVVSFGYKAYTGLTLCRSRNMLYWYCAHSKTIQESSANFTCQRTVARAENVNAMVIRGNIIYYDDGSGSIKMVHLQDGSRHSLERTAYIKTGGMKLFYDGYSKVTPSSEQSAFGRNKRPLKTKEVKGWLEGTDGYYYRLYTESANWAAAQAICRSHGANLAVVDSPTTIDYIKNMLGTKKYTNWIWIGGTYQKSNNKWKWVSGIPVKKTFWPSEGAKDRDQKKGCMAISPMDGFRDAYCSLIGNFLCQKGDYLKGPDGHYYKLSGEGADWATAQATCVSERGNLAIIDTPATFKYINHMMTTSKYTNAIWIGGRDEFSNNTWTWVNGMPVEKTYWSKERDTFSRRKNNCMKMNPATGARFAAFRCLWTDAHFLCQRRGDDIPSTRSPPPAIRDGYKQGFDGNYYKLFTAQKTWEDAKAQCAADDAMLAIIHSDQVYMYIKKSFPNNLWIGATDKEIEGTWKWANGKVVEKSYWHDGLDNSKAEEKDCAYTKDFKLDHEYCNEKKPFLCQGKGSFGKCGSGRECPRQILYPFGYHTGDNALPRGDEKFAHLHFEKGIPFFSRMAGHIFINTNGHITADKPESRWNFTDHATGHAAVYMMDLTTENGGDIFYRVTSDKSILERIMFEYALTRKKLPDTHIHNTTYQPSYALIVTWHEVRAKSDPSKKLTFQYVLSTDGNIVVSVTIYARLDVPGGLSGFSEGKCNHRFIPQSWRDLVDNFMYKSIIGINGIYVGQVSKPECGVDRTSYPIEVKYMQSYAAFESAQVFYFDGDNRITNVFIQSYTWDFPSVSFATNLVHELDHIHVKYIYFTDAPFVYSWGVAALVLRGNVDDTHMRNGKIKLPIDMDEGECYHHMFDESMDDVPCVLLNVMIPYSILNPVSGLTNVWLHNVSNEGFHVCSKQIMGMWSRQAIHVDYLAVTEESPAILEFGTKECSQKDKKDKKKKEFSKMDEKKSEIFCETVQFKYTYPIVPAVFVTPEVGDMTAGTEVVAWVKDTKSTYTVICVRGPNDRMDMDIKVHYTVHGVFDKCSKFTCPAHLECRLDAQLEPVCGCKKNCSGYEQMPICGSNLHTYRSRCELDKHMCETNTSVDDVTVAYPGVCRQYPYQTGMATLENVPGVPTVFCKEVKLNAGNFHSGSPMKVLLTVTWNQTEATDVPHEATASWSEDVTVNGFKACVMVTGRHFIDRVDPPSVHWVAYQSGVASDTAELEVGTVDMKVWYTGSRCHLIKLNRYTKMTKVFVSVEHGKPGVLKNAMTTWVEKMDGDGKGPKHMYRVCARELQNFDGVHEDVRIHYLAVHHTIDKYIVEPNEIHFKRRHFDKERPITPVCKTVKFNYNFPALPNPTVIVTAVNTSHLRTQPDFSPNDIAVWIEGNNDTHLTACFKSIRAGIYHEEVKLQYAIWPKLCDEDYVWYDGKCYGDVNKVNNETAKNPCRLVYNDSLPELDPGPAKSFFLTRRFITEMYMYDICEMDPDLLTHGCKCMNNGTCEQTETGHVKCKCDDDYVGKWCEKHVPESCRDYMNITAAMRPYLSTGVWYRFPGRQMVEHCPRYPGCASIDRTHPSVAEGAVTRNLIYGNYPMAEIRCEKGYGTVMVQNCVKFFIYNLQTVDKGYLGTELCFERKHIVPVRKD